MKKYKNTYNSYNLQTKRKMEREIINIVDRYIGSYISVISKKYNIDEDDLKSIWSQQSKNQNTETEVVKKPVSVLKRSKVGNVQTVVSNIEEDSDDDKDDSKTRVQPEIDNIKSSTCLYVFTKGATMGSVCGKKSCDGMVVCSKHKAYNSKILENGSGSSSVKSPSLPKKPTGTVKSPILPKKAPVNNNTYKPQPIDTESISSLDKSEHASQSSTKSDISSLVKERLNDCRLIKKHKITGKLWNEPTRLVIDSSERKVVIGRIDDNDKFADLRDEDIETCKKYSYKFELKSDNTKDPVSSAIKKVTSTSIDLSSINKIINDSSKKSLKDVVEQISSLKNINKDNDDDDDQEIIKELEDDKDDDDDKDDNASNNDIDDDKASDDNSDVGADE